MAAFDAGILPYYCEDFLVYLESILGKSKNTVNEYYYDLLLFFRYMKVRNGTAPQGAAFSEIPIADFSAEDLSKIRLSDLYSFLNYMNTKGRISPRRGRVRSHVFALFSNMHGARRISFRKTRPPSWNPRSLRKSSRNIWSWKKALRFWMRSMAIKRSAITV